MAKFFQELWETIAKFFTDYGVSMVIRTFLAFIVLIAGYYLIKLILVILRKLLGHKNKRSGKYIERSVQGFICSIIRFTLNLVLSFVVIYIIGIPLTGFVSIFSAAVLAIGLSLQDTISGFANGVVILACKHIKSGDYILINDGGEGTVKEINLMTVVLVTVDNKIVIVPNSTVTKSVVTNYSCMSHRRIAIPVGVSYDTDIDKARNISLELLKKDVHICQDKPMALVVTDFAASAINISIRCWVKKEDYWDVLFILNEKIISEFKTNNIVIPFTQVDVNIKK